MGTTSASWIFLAHTEISSGDFEENTAQLSFKLVRNGGIGEGRRGTEREVVRAGKGGTLREGAGRRCSLTLYSITLKLICLLVLWLTLVSLIKRRKRGKGVRREGGKEVRREGGKEGRRKGGKEERREGGTEGRRKGGTEGRREAGKRGSGEGKRRKRRGRKGKIIKREFQF
jgi:hypothetical protein